MEDNAEKVSAAFSRQSAVFDKLDEGNKLAAHLRNIFRSEVLSQLPERGNILELNCGTGLDAVYFAGKGHRVLATDNSPGMLAELEKKVKRFGLEDRIRILRRSFDDLDLPADERFDHIISNFGGLNCSEDLRKVLSQFAPLLKKDGKVTLVIMPRVSPWELLMAFKGKIATAFRRFKKATPASIEGKTFMCYYYSPSYVIKALKKDFRVLTLKGIYITVPPEFYAGFVERYPKMYRLLSRIDNAVSGYFPFNRCCDHFMITLQKR
jgi:ubiquinone/menaquinone biosynthesis C-methylase UbiE